MDSKQDDGRKSLIDDKEHEERLGRLSLITNLFRRYFSGEATEKEKQIIEDWDARSAWEKYRKNFKQNSEETDAAVDELWDKISEQLHFNKKNRSTIFGYSNSFPYAAIITVFIIIVGLSFYLLKDSTLFQKTQLTAETRTYFETTDKLMKKIRLPDGTQIFLNRNSKLSYQSTAFNKENREVWLEGEAFFEVTKDPHKPFIVHGGELETVVKGTSFNVKAYADIAKSVVSVRDGLVEVRNSDKALSMLDKNKQIIYNKDSESYITEEKSWEDISGWMDGRLVLNHADISELQLRLRQHYDVELQVRGNALEQIALKSSFARGTPVQVVLESLSLLYGISYKFTDERKVEIYK